MPTAPLEPLVRRLRTAALGAAAPLGEGHLLRRFARARDEAAFATLVKRHGPMVLAVCRRLLRDAHAAEDAFQATFLVLAKKAATLAEPELLARWLHGVACRTALRSRAEQARRRAREGRVEPPPPAAPDEGFVWRDLRAVLDEEIARLPTQQGAAVVLCYLEGRTNAEAAERLGCSRGTVATLLARARAQLRRRLTGRGLALPAGLAAAGVVPAALAESTVRAAAAFAAGRIRAAGPVSARAAALAEGVTKTMTPKKLKLITAALLLAGLAGTGAGLTTYRAAGQEPAAQAPPPRAPVPLPPPPAVRRTAPLDGAPATYRTANFVVTAPSQKLAERVSRQAEKHRKALALSWLGKEMPDWNEPCEVGVTLSEGGAKSATVLQYPGGKAGTVKVVRMELAGTLEQITSNLIPHEVTHTVVAHAFGWPPPRWADEGAAVLAERASSRRLHERLARKCADGGRLLPLRRLLALRDYPAATNDVAAMYALGYSLADFLVRSGGRPKFLKFVAAGERDTWDKAVRSHYGYKKVEELEAAWLTSLRKRVPQEASLDPKPSPAPLPPPLTPPVNAGEGTVKPKGRFPVGPAPVQALVTLGKDGRMRVLREQTIYTPQQILGPGGKVISTYVTNTSTTEAFPEVGEVRVTDARGGAISPKALAKLLKGETLVLVSADGRRVDPLHLRLVKDGTLVFVLPATAPVVPQPPAAAEPLPVPPPAPVPPPTVDLRHLPPIPRP
jgi:RNA polymerase sigma factor (sigma-70 family)